MSEPLNGRTALVTSGHKGIGARICLALAEAGADLIIHYHQDLAAAEQVKERIERLGRSVSIVPGDLSQPQGNSRLMGEVLSRHETIDILVNNVGVMVYKPFVEHSEDDFARVMQGTIGSTFLCSQAVLPAMRKQRWGRIINLGAAGAERAAGRVNLSAHMAGKAAVLSLTRTMALEVGKYGITVNAVCPGDIRHRELSLSEAEKMHDDRAPVPRPGTGDDVARVVVFLSLPGSSYINGAAITVSGGWEV